MTEDQPNSGIYLAGAGEPDPGPTLDDLVETDVEIQLEDALARVHDSTASALESEAGLPLDPEVRGLLDALSGSPGAGSEIRWLHDRVAAGTLTWETFWAVPHAEPGGSRLWGDVLRVLAERSRATLSATPQVSGSSFREGEPGSARDPYSERST